MKHHRFLRSMVSKTFISLQILVPALFLFAVNCQASAEKLPVSVLIIEEKEFTEQLRVQGNAESASIARVSPRIPGPIEAIFVKEGDAVEANKTRLFVIDPLPGPRMLSEVENVRVLHPYAWMANRQTRTHAGVFFAESAAHAGGVPTAEQQTRGIVLE